MLTRQRFGILLWVFKELDLELIAIENIQWLQSYLNVKPNDCLISCIIFQSGPLYCLSVLVLLSALLMLMGSIRLYIFLLRT